MGNFCSSFLLPFRWPTRRREGLTEGNQPSGEHTGDASKTQYSWDNRPKIDKSLLMVENEEGKMIHRLPNSVAGNQFIIQNCKDCQIFVFDNSASVTIDDCVNCKIFLGPVKGSVFMRDCHDCALMGACQQFRLRDCERLTTFLCCTTQPIIESSTHIKFGCFRLHYPQLEDQFGLAGLSLYNNNWSCVHDFTPVPGGTKNYSILPPDKCAEEYLQIAAHCCSLIDVSVLSSTVPVTIDATQKPVQDSCLVVFFCEEGYLSLVRDFINTMFTQKKEVVLVQTKEVKLSPDDACRVFETDIYKTFVASGPVVGLEYCGADVCRICHDVMFSSPSAFPGAPALASGATAAFPGAPGFVSESAKSSEMSAIAASEWSVTTAIPGETTKEQQGAIMVSEGLLESGSGPLVIAEEPLGKGLAASMAEMANPGIATGAQLEGVSGEHSSLSGGATEERTAPLEISGGHLPSMGIFGETMGLVGVSGTLGGDSGGAAKASAEGRKVHVSASAEQAAKEIENFYNFASMQMQV